MNLLLDTHAFLWFDLTPEKLSEAVYASLIDEKNTLYISLVSVWEMQIKLQLGKLELDDGLSETIEKQRTINQIQLLPIEPSHIYTLSTLPHHHRDPFDRMLLAQAKAENYTLLTADKQIQAYADLVSVQW